MLLFYHRPQLLDEQSKARADKRKLRRVLKEFEDEFFDQTGRKVQKEDRAPKEAEYMAYKVRKLSRHCFINQAIKVTSLRCNFQLHKNVQAEFLSN